MEFILLLFALILLISFFRPRRSSMGIHCIFLARENILFLKEWILYHQNLGIDKFYLYDNTGSKKAAGSQNRSKKLKLGSINKYNVDYGKYVSWSDEEVQQELKKICDSFGSAVVLEKWQPLDKSGMQIHGQEDGHADCIRRFGHQIDWLCVLDLDEWLYIKDGKLKSYLRALPGNVSCVQLKQKKMASRFRHLDKNVTDITHTKNLIEANGWKNIFRPRKTTRLTVHIWRGKGKRVIPDGENFRFNHYNANWGPEQTIECTQLRDSRSAKKARDTCENDKQCWLQFK